MYIYIYQKKSSWIFDQRILDHPVSLLLNVFLISLSLFFPSSHFSFFFFNFKRETKKIDKRKKKKKEENKSPEPLAALDQACHGILRLEIVCFGWKGILHFRLFGGIVVWPPNHEAHRIFRHSVTDAEGFVLVLCRPPLLLSLLSSVIVTFKIRSIV